MMHAVAIKAKFLGFGAALLILSACGGGSGGGGYGSNESAPAAPAATPATDANIAGTWRGTSNSATFNGNNTITLTLTQTGSSVSGTFTCTPGTLNCLHPNATIAGIVNGQTFTGTVLYPDMHSCSAFNASVSGTTLSGNYTCEDNVTDTGTWTATKQ